MGALRMRERGARGAGAQNQTHIIKCLHQSVPGAQHHRVVVCVEDVERLGDRSAVDKVQLGCCLVWGEVKPDYACDSVRVGDALVERDRGARGTRLLVNVAQEREDEAKRWSVAELLVESSSREDGAGTGAGAAAAHRAAD